MHDKRVALAAAHGNLGHAIERSIDVSHIVSDGTLRDIELLGEILWRDMALPLERLNQLQVIHVNASSLTMYSIGM